MFGWADVFSPTPQAVTERVRDLLTTGRVKALDGTEVPVQADTVCVHGDGPSPVEFVRRLRAELTAAAIEIRAPVQGF